MKKELFMDKSHNKEEVNILKTKLYFARNNKPVSEIYIQREFLRVCELCPTLT